MEKIIFLDKEEKDFINSFEKWEWKSSENFPKKNKYLKKIFLNTIQKINIKI